MRSTENRDIFRDDPKRLAEVWRAAAESALLDPQWTEQERQRRHAYYLGEAERFEGLVA